MRQIVRHHAETRLAETYLRLVGDDLMVAGRGQTDDAFETLLRHAITESVLGGMPHGSSVDRDLVARLRHYERQALQERLSSQTRQVIASARRLLGDGAEARREP